jgi:radical SAM protein with 4Fe4S-binding SPASM domain
MAAGTRCRGNPDVIRYERNIYAEESQFLLSRYPGFMDPLSGCGIMNIPEKPRIISWNVTLRCPLRCTHCYADAGEQDVPGVLSTTEAFRVIDQICETGKPVLILSGGEPLMREDIFEIARYGTHQGLPMAMGTSGYVFSHDTAARLREAGIKKVAISVDSADPLVHDTFRGMKGAWERAIQAICRCKKEGIPVQINTTVQNSMITPVEDLIALGTGLGVKDYQIFFPVPTGRAETDPGSPVAYEKFISEILTRYRDGNVNIRPTCAPQFRRIADQLGIKNRTWGRGCIAGIQYCRIYANGDVTPCPYLPVIAGNVRTTHFSRIWYESEVFSALRDPDRLQGKCHVCMYRFVCGGCRARAYGKNSRLTGTCGGLAQPTNPEGELCGADPWCPYEPGEET